MTSIELLGLTASIASLILAIVAIWLSVVFFRMSSELSEGTKEASKGIGASVDRLEKLFDKLYADTFSMMRDTVADMRKHIWPEEASEADKLSEEAERKADEKIGQLRESIESDLSRILTQQRVQDAQMNEVRREMQNLIERAINSSRQLESEAREETLREHILGALRMLHERQAEVTLIDLVNHLETSPGRLWRELERMKADKQVALSSSDFEPGTRIHLHPRYLS